MGNTYGEIREEFEAFKADASIRQLVAISDLIGRLDRVLTAAPAGETASEQVIMAKEALLRILKPVPPVWPGGYCLGNIGELPMGVCTVRFPELPQGVCGEFPGRPGVPDR